MRSIADTIANPPAQPPELIGGLLRRGELLVIGSLRGIGKSWAAMGAGVMLSLRTGRVLGQHPVVRQARVGYWHGELDPWSAHERWRLLVGSLGGEVPDPAYLVETFDAWRLHVVRLPRRVKVDDESATTQVVAAILDDLVEEAIVKHELEVLVLDPWRVFYAGAEDDSGETEAALAKLRDLSLRYGVTFIILHHVVKDAGSLREPEDLWRGSGRLADWASMRVTLLPHYSPADAKKMGMSRKQARRFVDVKYLRRSGETPDDHQMRWNPATGLWQPWSAGGRPPAVSADSTALVVKLTAAGGSWPSTSKAAESLGVDTKTAGKRLRQAETEGVVKSFDAGRNATGWRLVTVG